ncbi:hypothetical protein [Streptomyces sp. SM12]|uniref:hypothetical protein n=1 Tax=Streptomyces sp. SM12 TaxID=1071602 RepID=UPI0015E1762C|nr:hypothetical protein [Streptomyces sp. SM12]
MEEAIEKELVRRLAEFIFRTEEHGVSRGNSPVYSAARALLAAGLIDRDALDALSEPE